MLLWLLAIVAGVAMAAVQYGRGAIGARVLPLALLRIAAITFVVAMVLGAPVGRASTPPPQVVLDASESWLRATDSVAWHAALDSAKRLANGRTLQLYGDSLRGSSGGTAPRDHASRIRDVIDAATGRGTPSVVITDGELESGDPLAGLPRGSRLISFDRHERPDLAVATVDVPRALLAGDTVTVQTTLSSGAAGSSPARVTLRLDDSTLTSQSLPSAPAFTERAVTLRAVAFGGDRGAVLSVVLTSAVDAEPRNDTLAVGVDVTRAPGAVFVSTSPDFDAREAVAALRGVSALPTRAFYRVAPGMWRADGTLARVEERDVRELVREAPLVVIHGDTAVFGPPRAVTRGALLLFAPPAHSDGEWFAAAVPASPLAPALSALPLDSLPPLDVVETLPAGEWQGLVAHRGGSAEDRRALLAGWEHPRRIAVLGAAGLWRWRFRGGVRADAYAALFGALYDWLASGSTDRRAAVPDARVARAGEAIRWRRGAVPDSTVPVVLTRRGGELRRASLALRFNPGESAAESAPLPAGVYDVRTQGGDAVLVVNASRELLPHRRTVMTGVVGGEPATGDAPRARGLAWLYALVVALLCAEWLLRRQAGLR